MIKTETITINSRQLLRTWSDAGRMIERGGVRYSEAVDPLSSGRTITPKGIMVHSTGYGNPELWWKDKPILTAILPL